jgi:hypothetical protein
VFSVSRPKTSTATAHFEEFHSSFEQVFQMRFGEKRKKKEKKKKGKKVVVCATYLAFIVRESKRITICATAFV